MPTTRKQKKARKSRGLEMLSDIENIDIMLGGNHFSAREREGSLNSNLLRRSRSFASNESENENANVSRIREMVTLEQIPNMTKNQSQPTLVLRLTGCQVN